MKTTFIMCIVSALIGSVFAIGLTNWGDQTQAQSVTGQVALNTNQTPAIPTESVPQVESANPRTFTAEEIVAISVYEKVNRSVVNIRTVADAVDMYSYGPTEGAGSGWVYDREGHVVTNHHVIADSDLIEVTLFDGQTVEAAVVGADPANDIAVLKVKADEKSLVPVEIGESTTLRVGQKVYAIGNPFGFERTMTEGIISSLNRTLQAKTRAPRLINSIIQIDAALNRGNSGGPLLDTSGVLIGMNTAIATSTGENTGVGFAISANNIRRIVPLLIRDGRIIRPSLGIASFGTTTKGVLVLQLMESGPAEKAGIRAATWIERVRVPGGQMLSQKIHLPRADLIVAIDSLPVPSAEALLAEVEKHRPGERVVLHILRAGQPLTVELQLAEE